MVGQILSFWGEVDGIHIITLQGKSNCGKTTTLKRVIEKIIIRRLYSLLPVFSENEILQQCQADKGDVQCVFEYNGKKIGITTRGDTRDVLETDFEKYFSGCAVVVCAVHTYGETVEYVESVGAVAYHSKWVVAPRDKQRESAVNYIQSDFVIDELKTCL